MAADDPKPHGAVLVVDDDDDGRALVASFLEGEGFLALEARDGQEALDLLRSGAGPAIRVIVLDLCMPCISGWELVDILRGDPKLARIPIIVTSGVTVHGDASGVGATLTWLRKPFGMDALLRAVNDALESTPASDRHGSARIHAREGRASSPSHHDG